MDGKSREEKPESFFTDVSEYETVFGICNRKTAENG